jgi:hypothetical protein
MSEIFTPPKHGEDCISKGEETRDVSYALTLEERDARGDQALALEEAASMLVIRAQTQLKAAKEAQKQATSKAAKLRQENRRRAKVEPGRVALWHDYRDKTGYPLGRLVFVRVGGPQDGQVVEELSRPLTRRESQTELALPPAPEDAAQAIDPETEKTIAMLTALIAELIDGAGAEGRAVEDLVRAATQAGVVVDAPTMRALVERSSAWALIDGDRVALAGDAPAPEVNESPEQSLVKPRALAVLRERGGKSTTANTIIKGWRESWGEPPSKEQVIDALANSSEAEKTARGFKYVEPAANADDENAAE